MSELRERVLQALTQEQAPGTETDVVDAGFIRALSVSDGAVSFVLDADGPVPERLRGRIEARIRAVEGVRAVQCYQSESSSEAPQLTDGPKPIRGVAKTVLIGSGKGGVGKSTVTANLALALADQGLRVGLLDADIYGPSVPQMMGTDGRPVSYDGTLIPIAAHGIKLMSVGLMLDPTEALVWRGPILANTLAQMLHEVRWEPLDILLIDLPPGTGDVQITLAQEARIDGAVVVTTPQRVALNDARRSIDLLKRTDVTILGMVENMATHICSGCGREEAVFGTGGAAEEARAQEIDLLGSLPLEPLVCAAADDGVPAVRSAPESVSAKRFHEIATALREALERA